MIDLMFVWLVKTDNCKAEIAILGTDTNLVF